MLLKPLIVWIIVNCVVFSCNVTRDGRISDPAIRIQSDFHYPVKSDSGRTARFTSDQIRANYCVNISQTICQCSLSIVWLMLSQHCWSQQINDPRLALMNVLSTQWMLYRNIQMRISLSAAWTRRPANGRQFIRRPYRVVMVSYD